MFTVLNMNTQAQFTVFRNFSVASGFSHRLVWRRENEKAAWLCQEEREGSNLNETRTLQGQFGVKIRSDSRFN